MRVTEPLLALFLLAAAATASGADIVPTDVQLPGTQPLEAATLEAVAKCDNCHGGYDPAAEPWRNWAGSMMAHASRDPIFWATVAIAEQDFDGAGDLCIRCHVARGWLAGRSTPTDGSGLNENDANGVQCDLCHRMTNPDGSEHPGVQTPPFVANDEQAPATGYYGGGMYVLSPTQAPKLGPYANAVPPHSFEASAFHRSSELCGTCHDVSNPVVGDLAHNHGAPAPLAPNTWSGVPGSPVDGKAAFNNFPYAYGVVERTFSEHAASLLSQTRVADYDTLPADLQDGAIRTAYEAALLGGPDGNYADTTERFFTCQTCHMRPVAGKGCNKNAAPERTDVPRHDLVGANYWMPEAMQYLDGIGGLRLGGGLSAGQRAALDAGRARALQNLADAASLTVDGNAVKVTNLTGHKLISGYPEGRRMWVAVRWFDAAGTTIVEDGAYGSIPAQLGATTTPVETLLDLRDPYTRIYEVHGAMTPQWARQLLALGTPPTLPLSYDRETGAVARTLGQLALQPSGTYHETFHFVLNNLVAKDTRIPPWGLGRAAAEARNVSPVPASQYGDPGPLGSYAYWDEVVLNPPPGAHHATIELRYQPTSWEYVQFLYLANDGLGFLGAEGDLLLDAWLATAMAAPHTMATTTWTAAIPACADGLDNDRDGLVDDGEDPGCSDAGDISEHSLALPCDDRLDGDGDGVWDYPRDPGCLTPASPSEVYDDGDGVPDGRDNCPYWPNAGQGDADYDDGGDACECGDADGDGVPDAGDTVHLRRALAGVDPGVLAPARCNVHGAADLADDDGDGVPNDCDLLDSVVLTRRDAGLAPGVSAACAPALP